MAPSFDPIEAKMRAADLSDAAVSAFKLNFDALAGGESGMVRKKKKKMKKKKKKKKKRRSQTRWARAKVLSFCHRAFRASSLPYSDPAPVRAIR
jgi:hypothetical protein